MARLIDADAFIAEHCADCKYYKVNGLCTKEAPVCGSVQIVTELPTIDAVEVVHGRWEKASEKMPIYRCSICKERNLFKNGYNVFSNYCPNCGADMRERKDHEDSRNPSV